MTLKTNLHNLNNRATSPTTKLESDAKDALKINQKQIKKIYTELGYTPRVNIMAAVRTEPCNLSTLARKLGCLASEIHRNTNRLQKSGLIQKDSDGIFSLTTLGIAMYEQISACSFLTKYSEFFNSHSFGEMPSRFIQSIGTLRSCRYIDSATEGFDASIKVMVNMIKNSEKYLYIIAPYTIAYLTEIIFNHISTTRTTYQLLLPKNVTIASEDKAITEKYKIRQLIAEKKLQRKMVDKVSVSVMVTDKEAGIAFGNRKGETDFQNVFYSSEKQFRDWCLDYFYSRWNAAEFFTDPGLIKRT